MKGSSMTKLKIFTKGFTKTVHGYIEVEAVDPQEAEEKFDSGEYDEFDNKSEAEYGKWEEQ
jgi:hypothetical protein